MRRVVRGSGVGVLGSRQRVPSASKSSLYRQPASSSGSPRHGQGGYQTGRGRHGRAGRGERAHARGAGATGPARRVIPRERYVASRRRGAAGEPARAPRLRRGPPRPHLHAGAGAAHVRPDRDRPRYHRRAPGRRLVRRPRPILRPSLSTHPLGGDRRLLHVPVRRRALVQPLRGPRVWRTSA